MSASALALILALSAAHKGSLPAQRDTLHHVSAIQRRLQFAVPSAWGILKEEASDTLGIFGYFIWKPGIPRTANASTNVIITVQRAPATQPFPAATRAWLGRVWDSSMVTLRDTLIGSAQRAVFWEGKDGEWRYLGFDDFARAGDVWVHVRIMEPMSAATPPGWAGQFEAETRAVLQSIRVDGTSAFPVPIGYPVVAQSPLTHQPRRER